MRNLTHSLRNGVIADWESGKSQMTIRRLIGSCERVNAVSELVAIFRQSTVSTLMRKETQSASVGMSEKSISTPWAMPVTETKNHKEQKDRPKGTDKTR